LVVVIVELPLPAVSETVLPLTGWLLPSKSVTVIVEVVVPSAVTDVGFALTVEAVALTVPAEKFTVAVCVIVTLSVVSFAV
jgi:hypothetical protein